MQKITPEIPYELAEWNKLFGEETAGALWQAHLAGHTDVIKDIGFWEQRIRDHGLPGDYFGFQYSLGNYFVDSHAKKRIEIIDALLFGYGSSEQPEIQVQCAKALYQKGWILRQKPSDPLGAMACYDTLLSLYGASNHPDLQIQCAQALFDKASILETNLLDLLRSGRIMNPHQARQAEIEIYDVLLSCYGTSNTPEIQKLCAYALNRKGDLQGWFDNSQEAADTYKALVTHYGESKDLEIQVLCVEVLYKEGCHRIWLGDLPAALICYDELLSRYSQISLPGRQAQCLRDLETTAHYFLQNMRARSSRKMPTWTNKIDYMQSETDIYDVLLSHYWSSYKPKIQDQCAQALFDKTCTLDTRLLDLLRSAWVSSPTHSMQAEIDIYDGLLSRCGTSDTPEIQKECAQTLNKKGDLQGWLDNPEGAIESYNTLVTHYGESKDLEMQLLCVEVLYKEGCHRIWLGDLPAVLICYDELLSRYSRIENPARQDQCLRKLDSTADNLLQNIRARSKWKSDTWTKKIDDMESEIDIYDVLLSRYWSSFNPKIQELFTKILLKKGLILGGMLTDSQAMLNIYSTLHTHYEDSKDKELQVLCAMALFNEGCYWTRKSNLPAAFICYDKLQAQYTHIEHPKIQARCQRALLNSAEWLLILGSRQDAIQRLQKALGRTSNKDQEFVVVRFLLWLAEAGTCPDEVLTAIRTLSPEVELTCGFKNIGPLVAALPEPRKTQAEYFLNFFKQHRDAGYFRKLAFPSGGPNEDFPSG